MPAEVGPTYLQLSRAEALDLLRRSGAWLLRCSSDPGTAETAWWYVVCDHHDPAQLSKKVRNQLRRAERECTTRRVEAAWLAEHGYECYLAAFRRYANAAPIGPAQFRENTLRMQHGPWDLWAVFVGDVLASYSECAVEEQSVAAYAIKHHPDYLQHYTSYALIATLIQYYVVERGMLISNGARSIAHDTNVEEFLLKLGFRRQYCRLNVVYRPPLGMAVAVAFPFRRLLAGLPDRGLVHNLKAVLLQEEIHRSCLLRNHPR